MNWKPIIIIIIILFLGIGIFSLLSPASQEKEIDVDFILQPTSPLSATSDSYIAPDGSKPAKSATEEPIIPGGVTQTDPTPAPGYLSTDDELNIIIDEPQPEAVLSSPFIVSGEARVFENSVIVQVTNNQGEVLIDEVVRARPADIGQFGSFKITLHYAFSTTKEGYVQVFSESARDGSRENLIKIPVKFE